MERELDPDDPRWWPRTKLLLHGRGLRRIARQGEDVPPEQLRWRAEETSGLRVLDGGAVVDAHSGEALEGERILEHLDNFRNWIEEAARELFETGLEEERVEAALASLYAHATRVEEIVANDPHARVAGAPRLARRGGSRPPGDPSGPGVRASRIRLPCGALARPTGGDARAG